MSKDSDAKGIYRNLCSDKLYPSLIFMQDWWLDAVCGEDAWQVWAYPENSPQYFIPYYSPYGGTLEMPFFTQMLGSFRVNKDDKKQQWAALRYWAKKFKTQAFISYNFHEDSGVLLPFLWEGLNQSLRYTYKIDDIKRYIAEKEHRQGLMNEQTRRHIRKAEKNDISVRACSTEDFVSLYELTFKAKNMRKSKEEFKALSRLITATLERQKGFLLGGYDKEQVLHSAAFIAMHGNTAYYIAGGSNPEYHYSQSQSLVLLEAIRKSSYSCDVFDFEGSMLEGIAEFFRGFGAEANSYSRIYTKPVPVFLRAYRKLLRMSGLN